MPDQLPNHLEPRVTSLERDVASLAASVKSLAVTVERGFEAAAANSERLHTELQGDIREITKRTETIGRPNYNALGVGFAVVLAVLGYYVSSQTGPIQEQIKAEVEARRSSDNSARDEITRNTQRLYELQGGVVTSSPEQRNDFFRRVDSIESRITAIETWDSARKLWKDSP